MLSVEECMEILDVDTLCFEESMTVDCNLNILSIAAYGITINLNEAQKRLLVCLIKKINAKREIINIVWYENHQRISDNNYHQLAFQLRALFQRNGLPANLLVTIPYYGLKLNESLWRSLINDAPPSRLAQENKTRSEQSPLPAEKEGDNPEKKSQPGDKPPYIFMLSFFMLSLVVYWFN